MKTTGYVFFFLAGINFLIFVLASSNDADVQASAMKFFAFVLFTILGVIFYSYGKKKESSNSNVITSDYLSNNEFQETTAPESSNQSRMNRSTKIEIIEKETKYNSQSNDLEILKNEILTDCSKKIKNIIVEMQGYDYEEIKANALEELSFLIDNYKDRYRHQENKIFSQLEYRKMMHSIYNEIKENIIDKM